MLHKLSSQIIPCQSAGGEEEEDKGEELEEEMCPCNTEGVACMTLTSELTVLTDQVLFWFSSVVTVLETLDSEKFHKEISIQHFVVRLESWIDHADCVGQWLEFSFQGGEGEVWW